MSGSYVPAELRRLVYERAAGRCENCLVPEDLALAIHEIDHIIAEKHGGDTVETNLALSCAICNKLKGSDVASVDPQGGVVTRLYHPRRDHWTEHFELRGAEIFPRTPVGRATVHLLRLNHPDRLEERNLLLTAGLVIASR